MLKWCTCSLVLPLAIVAGAVHAAEDGWGAPPQGPTTVPASATGASSPAVILGLPVAVDPTPGSGSAGLGSPAASLGTPMPCASPDCPPVPPPVIYDPRVNPVNFETDLPAAADIRGQQPDNCFVPPPAPGCGPGCPKFYVDADYMLFAIKNGPGGPPLVTTTTPTALATLPNAGGIGVPGTAVLYNRSQDYGPLSGGRLNAWGWLDCDNILGANVGGFWLQQGSTTTSFASNGAAGTAPLFIPLNVLPTTPFVTPGPNGLGVAAPPVGGAPGGAGVISITSRSELWGAEANALVNFLRFQGLELNGLAGLRYMSLQEDLTLSTATANNPNVPGSFILFPGAGFGPGILATQDTFSTRNDFYGAQVGLQARTTLGCFFVDLTGKLALGDSYESLNVYGLTGVNGTNALTGAPVRGLFPGGILALPTNSGHFTKNDFAVVPEVGLKLGYAITKNIRVTVGYDGIYWSSVVRPGDQINPAVDPRAIPAANAIFTPGAAFTGPGPLFKLTDFWRKESRSAWRSRSDYVCLPGRPGPWASPAANLFDHLSRFCQKHRIGPQPSQLLRSKRLPQCPGCNRFSLGRRVDPPPRSGQLSSTAQGRGRPPTRNSRRIHLMLQWRKASLALALGWLGTAACVLADDWGASPPQVPAAPSSGVAAVPAVSLGLPVPADSPSGQGSSGRASPAASLGAPIPCNNSPDCPRKAAEAIVDRQLRPTSYQADWSAPAQVRGSEPDNNFVTQATTGPAQTSSGTITPLYAWQGAPDDIALPPRLQGASPRFDGAPMPPGPVQMYPVVPDYTAVPGGVAPAVPAGPSLSPWGYYPGNELYISADALLWWIKPGSIPALGTSFHDGGPGAFGAPGSQVALGSTGLPTDMMGGARIMVGYWFDDQHLCGLEGGGFYLGQANQTLSVNSFGGTNLAVPVVLVNAAGPAGAIPIAGFTTAGGPRDVGAIKLTDQTTLYGGEFNWRSNCITCPNAFIDFIAGFRTLGLDDDLNFATATSGVGLTNLLGRGMAGAPGLTERDTSDQFNTHNHFYGGQVGFIGEWRCGCWVFDLKAKIGLGDTQQMATINGSTVDRVGGSLVTFPAGLLASSSNTGMFTRDQMSFVPEVGLTLAYQFTERLRFFVGYNFLYWSNVARRETRSTARST